MAALVHFRTLPAFTILQMLLSIGTCLQLLSAMWVICRLVDSKTGSQIGPDAFKYTGEGLTLGAVFHTLEAPTGGKPSDSSTAAELTHLAFLSSLGKPYLNFVVEAVQPALNFEGNENAFDRLMAGAKDLVKCVKPECHIYQTLKIHQVLDILRKMPCTITSSRMF